MTRLARNPYRRGILAALLACATLPALAQYARTEWPARQTVPALQGADIAGRAWDLAELKGKVIVLNFWGTWCPPCVEEIPALQALHDTVDDDVQVISVSVKDSASAVRRFVKSHQVTFPVLLDARGELASRWGLKSVPTTVLIDKQGRPRWRIEGMVDWAEREPAGWLDALRR